MKRWPASEWFVISRFPVGKIRCDANERIKVEAKISSVLNRIPIAQSPCMVEISIRSTTLPRTTANGSGLRLLRERVTLLSAILACLRQVIWLGRVRCYNTGRCPSVKVWAFALFASFVASDTGSFCHSLFSAARPGLVLYPRHSTLVLRTGQWSLPLALAPSHWRYSA